MTFIFVILFSVGVLAEVINVETQKIEGKEGVGIVSNSDESEESTSNSGFSIDSNEEILVHNAEEDGESSGGIGISVKKVVDKKAIDFFNVDEVSSTEEVSEEGVETLGLINSLEGQKILLKSESDISFEEGKFPRFLLSNGEEAEVRIPEEHAFLIARANLRLESCSVENNDCVMKIKEIDSEVFYELSAEKEISVLGIFKKWIKISGLVSAKNGAFSSPKKELWAILANE